MQVLDLTTEQDEAFIALRKYHNRDNPQNQMTKSQLVQSYITHALNKAVREANEKVNGKELRSAFEAASNSDKNQIKAILGL